MPWRARLCGFVHFVNFITPSGWFFWEINARLKLYRLYPPEDVYLGCLATKGAFYHKRWWEKGCWQVLCLRSWVRLLTPDRSLPTKLQDFFLTTGTSLPGLEWVSNYIQDRDEQNLSDWQWKCIRCMDMWNALCLRWSPVVIFPYVSGSVLELLDHLYLTFIQSHSL